jgi:hypothetical protein
MSKGRGRDNEERAAVRCRACPELMQEGCDAGTVHIVLAGDTYCVCWGWYLCYDTFLTRIPHAHSHYFSPLGNG